MTRSRPASAPFLAAGILFVGAALGPATLAQTTIDYDGKTDFTSYKTYSWGTNTSSGNAAADTRIIESIDRSLLAAGWKKVEPGLGEVVVAAHATIREDTNVDAFYTGWGPGWGWGATNVGAGVGSVSQQKLRVGTLVVDMFDASRKALIWRATAEGALSTKPEENLVKIEKVVTRMFKKFPPTPTPPAPPESPPPHH
ncbi:MAG TPA: DUF4136 domain-containing protein [Candidatus Polarisedimenticolia bacterium]|jgi:hypothetical protein|nr:DUF4136 domain-containing protein [Candidatus Polarisedimenticolia bacterium]